MAGYFGIGLRANTSERDDGNFDYNEEVLVEDSQIRSRDFWIRPIGGVSNQAGPFNFSIERSEDQYLVMNAARLEVTARVVKGDGNELSPLLDIVAPVNLLGACMWENVEVRLNQQPMSGASAVNAGYKAFIDTMFSYDQDSRHTHLLTQFSYIDSPGHFDYFKIPINVLKKKFLQEMQNNRIPKVPLEEKDKLLKPGAKKADKTEYTAAEIEAENLVRKQRQQQLLETYFNQHMTDLAAAGDVVHPLEVTDDDSETNHGFYQRYDIVSGSAPFTMYSPIPHDFFNLNNHIAPMNKIDIKLSKYPDRFILNTYLTHKGYKIELMDMKMHLRTITRRERIRPPLKETYRMNETNLLKQVVPMDQTNFSFRMFNTGVMPKTIVLAMVPTAAAEGAYNYNPFHFHHFDLRRIALMINGEERPQGGLEFNFSRLNRDCQRGYHWLFANTGALSGERGNLISFPAFQSGCFLLPFDLTPDKCNGFHNHNAELGHIDVNIVWGTPLPMPVTILYELVFNKVLVNDKTSGTVAVVDVAV